MSSKKTTGNYRITFIRNTWEMEEFIKCKQNPWYFINTYVRISHPVLGAIPFKLYPFQISLLNVYIMYRYSICLKPRQMGISMLVAAYMLWMALFHEHKYCLVVSIKQTVARSLLRRIKFMYLHLPDFLKMEVTNGGKDTVGTADRIAFANYSEINAVASTDNAGRSDSLSLLVMDEAAFQPHAGTTWGAAQQTLATGGQAIVLSTAYGIGNFFHTSYTEALQGLNAFHPVRLTWQMHPDRDQQWYEEQRLALGPKRTAQEIDCNFLQSGYNVFDMAKILAIDARIKEEGWLQELMPNTDGKPQIYVKHYPRPDGIYTLGGDIASGRARDFSTFSIMDEQGVEAACFKGKIGLREYAYLAMDWGYKYNQALLAPEANAIGEGAIATIQENDYPNLYHTIRKTLRTDEFDRAESPTAGWFTTGKTRHEIITGMDDDLNDELVELNNPFFVQEAMTFIYNQQNKPIAMGKDGGIGGIRSSNMYEEQGESAVYTDDSILGACITNEVRKSPEKFRGYAPIYGG